MNWLHTLFLIAIAYFIRQLVLPPRNFPRNIPTIPFYVVFVPILTSWDQEKIFNVFFREKIEKHGAVTMYFGSRWNILVSRPEYVAQILRNNDVFEKSGNCEKIPHAVVSEYLGDNVISAGNAKWRKYRKVITNSILFPDLAPLESHVTKLVDALESQVAVQKTFCLAGTLQRFFLGCIGECVLGCDLHSETGELSIIRRVQYLKKQIFRPFYMGFPILDKLPIPSRNRARAEIRHFKALLRAKVLQVGSPETMDRLGPKLAKAYEDGELTQVQCEDNTSIIMIAGHENPEMLMSSTLYMLAKRPDIQNALRAQIAGIPQKEKEELPLLNSIILESLRLFPPIGQLVNRITRKDVCLGKDIRIPKGVYIGTNSFYTQRDGSYWKDPDTFIPQRWGQDLKEVMSTYSLAKSRCELTAFHGRNRACLGEKFALTEVRKALIAILEKFEFSLDPAWKERITPSGPIWPVQLSLDIRKLRESIEC